MHVACTITRIDPVTWTIRKHDLKYRGRNRMVLYFECRTCKERTAIHRYDWQLMVTGHYPSLGVLTVDADVELQSPRV